MLTTQFHLNYRVRPRLWTSFDATFYRGGRTTISGQAQQDQQHNTRIGGTVVVPIGINQSIKFAASTGTWVQSGSNFTSFAVAYQYLWNPKF